MGEWIKFGMITVSIIAIFYIISIRVIDMISDYFKYKDLDPEEAYAKKRGYFWLPCPACGEWFGGHEIKKQNYSGLSPYRVGIMKDNNSSAVCNNCYNTDEVESINKANGYYEKEKQESEIQTVETVREEMEDMGWDSRFLSDEMIEKAIANTG